MRPPIPYPDGRIIGEEEPENVSQKTSVLVRWSFLSLFRLQFKGAVLLPLVWLGFVVVQICVIAVSSSLSAFEKDEVTLFSTLLLCICVTLFLVMLLCAFLPFQYTFLWLIRGSESLFTITPKEVKDVAKRFPISIPWNKVLFIRQWSGDFLIITFGGGVLIPREAFRNPIDAEDFTHAARQFHRLSRESQRPQK